MIEAGDEDGPDDTNEPRPEGVHWHFEVICVGDGRPDLGIRRVILEVLDVLKVEIRVVEVGYSRDVGNVA